MLTYNTFYDVASLKIRIESRIPEQMYGSLYKSELYNFYPQIHSNDIKTVHEIMTS